ncbi:DUF58 domain-containing protein [Spirochaeta cellobiosiphila]|uniref:DUF58 domain-containing protein n=1 Tax=Spirochaeta cellobiosiphila TaxID=504483 RepID=UPI0012EBBEB8|nr:DUF58 domain-containing protein [Spirochaeta cellobiosiphila]
MSGVLGLVVKGIFFFYPVSLFFFTLYSYLSIRYTQNFSKEHLCKGDEVQYKLLIENSGALSSVIITAHFKKVHPYLKQELEDFKITLSPGRSIKKQYKVSCPYRGIYVLGLSTIVIQDHWGIFCFKISIWQRTFYVYPRLLTFTHYTLRYLGFSEGQLSNAIGIQNNFSLFAYMEEYKWGDPLNRFDWKRWLYRNQAVIKMYEQELTEGVCLIFDTFAYRNDIKNLEEWADQDCLIEVLFALLDYFVNNHIPLVLLIPMPEIREVIFSSQDDIQDFINHSLEICFSPEKSMHIVSKYFRMSSYSKRFLIGLSNDIYSLVDTSREYNNGNSHWIYAISRLPSEEIISFIQERNQGADHFSVINNSKEQLEELI